MQARALAAVHDEELRSWLIAPLEESKTGLACCRYLDDYTIETDRNVNWCAAAELDLFCLVEVQDRGDLDVPMERASDVPRGFSAVARGVPNSLHISLPSPSNVGTPAKTNARNYLSSASARTPQTSWMDQQQRWGSLREVEREIEERLRSSAHTARLYGTQLRASFHNSMPSPSMPSPPVSVTIDDATAASAAPSVLSGSGSPSSPPVLSHASSPAMRTPQGVTSELARMQALLDDSTAEKRRLEADLAAARQALTDTQQSAATSIDQERQRYRREVEFVRSGVEAAAAQRDAAVAKRKESHERALRRAVAEAEERERAANATAIREREEAHQEAMRAQAARHELELGSLRGQLVSLATEVRALQRGGLWPGHSETASTDSFVQLPLVDADNAFRELSRAIAIAGYSGGPRTEPSRVVRNKSSAYVP